jgi:hypothetical protein
MKFVTLSSFHRLQGKIFDNYKLLDDLDLIPNVDRFSVTRNLSEKMTKMYQKSPNTFA